ncbi:hypothetical protein T492DRAFT_1076032 [Pavlovales sp. CCMP2436]|nr:hypothetical protein T492DRAFT_1076032 [Pavlovales sp. CCMP2436]
MRSSCYVTWLFVTWLLQLCNSYVTWLFLTWLLQLCNSYVTWLFLTWLLQLHGCCSYMVLVCFSFRCMALRYLRLRVMGMKEQKLPGVKPIFKEPERNRLLGAQSALWYHRKVTLKLTE